MGHKQTKILERYTTMYKNRKFKLQKMILHTSYYKKHNLIYVDTDKLASYDHKNQRDELFYEAYNLCHRTLHGIFSKGSIFSISRLEVIEGHCYENGPYCYVKIYAVLHSIKDRSFDDSNIKQYLYGKDNYGENLSDIEFDISDLFDCKVQKDSAYRTFKEKSEIGKNSPDDIYRMVEALTVTITPIDNVIKEIK